jgi:signal peptidase I
LKAGILRVVEKIIGPLTKENAIQWAQSIGIALVLALTIRHFLFEPFKIPSGSMIPTLQVGDKILVNKFILGVRVPFTFKRFFVPRKPIRGEVVVFRSPTGERKDLVKRVVGLPGERIKIDDDGRILVNGEPVTNHPFIAKNTYYNQRDFGEYGTTSEVTVPENSYFVLGDNSRHSRDSRTWGFLPLSHIKGRVVCVWWPLWKARRVI